MKTNSKISGNWFADWANEYDRTLGKIQRHHNLLELVVKQSKIKKHDKILDIGCGTGLLSLKFLKQADCNITAIDSSIEMLNIFKSKIERLSLNLNIECDLQDASSLDFKNNSFDIVASTVTLHHLKNKLPTISKIYDILKPNGKLVIGDIDIDTTGDILDTNRFLKIFNYLKDELLFALNDGGVEAFSRMYDNGKKHILNYGEYCISFEQWKNLCKQAGFKKIYVYNLPDFKWFKVLKALK